MRSLDENAESIQRATTDAAAYLPTVAQMLERSRADVEERQSRTGVEVPEELKKAPSPEPKSGFDAFLESQLAMAGGMRMGASTDGKWEFQGSGGARTVGTEGFSGALGGGRDTNPYAGMERGQMLEEARRRYAAMSEDEKNQWDTRAMGRDVDSQAFQRAEAGRDQELQDRAMAGAQFAAGGAPPVAPTTSQAAAPQAAATPRQVTSIGQDTSRLPGTYENGVRVAAPGQVRELSEIRANNRGTRDYSRSDGGSYPQPASENRVTPSSTGVARASGAANEGLSRHSIATGGGIPGARTASLSEQEQGRKNQRRMNADFPRSIARA